MTGEFMSTSRLVRGFCSLVALVAFAFAANAEQPPTDSPQATRIVALVNKAADLVNREGKAAFNEFRKPGSEWFNGPTYLFAYDMEGNVLLNPAFPKREGTNVAGDKDANGKPFQNEILKTYPE